MWEFSVVGIYNRKRFGIVPGMSLDMKEMSKKQMLLLSTLVARKNCGRAVIYATSSL